MIADTTRGRTLRVVEVFSESGVWRVLKTTTPVVMPVKIWKGALGGGGVRVNSRKKSSFRSVSVLAATEDGGGERACPPSGCVFGCSDGSGAGGRTVA